MFTELFQKNSSSAQPPPPEPEASSSPAGPRVKESRGSGIPTEEDIEPRVIVHYGIPSTASIVAFDPIKSLLAVGTLDGRIKVFGGDSIEGLLVSSKQQHCKYLQFLQNQGFLVSVTNENEIQVRDLEQRQIVSTVSLQSPTASLQDHLVNMHFRKMVLKLSSQSVFHHVSSRVEVKLETSSKISTSGEGVEDSLLIMCCTNAMHLYSLNSPHEGDRKRIRSINLQKTCCWTAIYQKNDKEQGLIVFYKLMFLIQFTSPSIS